MEKAAGETVGLRFRMADVQGAIGVQLPVIVKVQDNSPASASGLKAGMVILSVNGVIVWQLRRACPPALPPSFLPSPDVQQQQTDACSRPRRTVCVCVCVCR